MHLVLTLMVGLVVGVVAKLFLPSRGQTKMVITIVLGLAGSLLAGWAGRAMGLYNNVGELPGLIASVIGAVILLVAYRAISGRPVA